MQWLAAISVKRPVFASVLIIALTVIGAFSFARLGLDRFPKVDFPTSSSPPAAGRRAGRSRDRDHRQDRGGRQHHQRHRRARSIVFRGHLAGLHRVPAREGHDIAAQEMRDKVNPVLPLLPRSTEQPTVQKLEPDAAPVLTLPARPQADPRHTEYADKKLRRQIEDSAASARSWSSAAGCGRSTLARPGQLQAFDLTVTDDSRALQTQNVQIPGGHMEQGATSSPCARTGACSGRGVRRHRRQATRRLCDPAARRRAGRGRHGRVADPCQQGRRADGARHGPAAVRHQHGAGGRVGQGALEDIGATVPPGYHIDIVRDKSEFIKAAIKRCRST